MLPPDEWDQVLNRLTGALYKGTERIGSAAILNALQVPTDDLKARTRIGTDMTSQRQKQEIRLSEGGNKMLEADRWPEVLGRVTGTVYRGTERISSNALFNLLEVGPDPVTRQKVDRGCDPGPEFPELAAGGAPVRHVVPSMRGRLQHAHAESRRRLTGRPRRARKGCRLPSD
jgi:hypothetical protein